MFCRVFIGKFAGLNKKKLKKFVFLGLLVLTNNFVYYTIFDILCSTEEIMDLNALKGYIEDAELSIPDVGGELLPQGCWFSCTSCNTGCTSSCTDGCSGQASVTCSNVSCAKGCVSGCSPGCAFIACASGCSTICVGNGTIGVDIGIEI